MYPLTRFLCFAAAGAFTLSTASIPVRADEFFQNVGPVGPHDAILTTVGSKRLIAFYEPDGANCGLHVVIWNSADESGDSPARVRVSLMARQTVHIGSADNTTGSCSSQPRPQSSAASSTCGADGGSNRRRATGRS